MGSAFPLDQDKLARSGWMAAQGGSCLLAGLHSDRLAARRAAKNNKTVQSQPPSSPTVLKYNQRYWRNDMHSRFCRASSHKNLALHADPWTEPCDLRLSAPSHAQRANAYRTQGKYSSTYSEPRVLTSQLLRSRSHPSPSHHLLPPILHRLLKHTHFRHHISLRAPAKRSDRAPPAHAIPAIHPMAREIAVFLSGV